MLFPPGAGRRPRYWFDPPVLPPAAGAGANTGTYWAEEVLVTASGVVRLLR